MWTPLGDAIRFLFLADLLPHGHMLPSPPVCLTQAVTVEARLAEDAVAKDQTLMIQAQEKLAQEVQDWKLQFFDQKYER